MNKFKIESMVVNGSSAKYNKDDMAYYNCLSNKIISTYSLSDDVMYVVEDNHLSNYNCTFICNGNASFFKIDYNVTEDVFFQICTANNIPLTYEDYIDLVKSTKLLYGALYESS